MNLGCVKILTFDCYGTLIDWESGIVGALQLILRRHGCEIEDEALLELYAREEAEAERPPFRPYRHVLREAARGVGRALEIEDGALENAIVDSLGGWPPFPDTVDALRRLQRRFRLVITSNIDRDLFALTSASLGITFDHVVTAEDVRSYKPSHGHWLRVMRDLNVDRNEIVHVAQSLYHDHVPARELGIRSVWINRRAGRKGSGATVPAEAGPDLTFTTLAQLADYLRL